MVTHQLPRSWLAMPISDTVSALTTDPGYRFIAQQFEIVRGSCACVGPGPIPDPDLIEWANQIKAQSLDPACSYLAGALAQAALGCCPTVPSPINGIIAAGARDRTLDPGARMLGKLLDGFVDNCCSD